MPIQRCKSNGRLGWKWGKSGRCYVGSGGRAKARRQERAIRASGWVGNVRRPVRTTVVPTNPLKADPTRTTTLRRRFEIDLRRRFSRLRKLLTALIVEEDALGIKPRTKNPFIGNVENQRWRFHATQQKVDEFRNWLQTQTNLNILAEGIQEEQKYWQAYIREGYEKGAGRAFDDTNRARRAMAGGSEQLAFFQGTREEFLRAAFAHPVSVDKVKVLAGRVFTELKGVSESMAQRMTRELTDGLSQGKNPRVIARDLNKALDIGKNRSRVIARTEIIRAHGEGQLDVLERLGVEEVGVAVEWSTAGDGRVCQLCAPLEGIVMKLKEARGTIPRHPQCRCSYIPANVGEKQKGQTRGKQALDKARNDSIRAEIPERSKRTLAQQKALSKWPGADVKFGKVRPKSVLGQPTRTTERFE